MDAGDAARVDASTVTVVSEGGAIAVDAANTGVDHDATADAARAVDDANANPADANATPADANGNGAADAGAADAATSGTAVDGGPASSVKDAGLVAARRPPDGMYAGVRSEYEAINCDPVLEPQILALVGDQNRKWLFPLMNGIPYPAGSAAFVLAEDGLSAAYAFQARDTGSMGQLLSMRTSSGKIVFAPDYLTFVVDKEENYADWHEADGGVSKCTYRVKITGQYYDSLR
jgi:hypothetical protein